MFILDTYKMFTYTLFYFLQDIIIKSWIYVSSKKTGIALFFWGKGQGIRIVGLPKQLGLRLNVCGAGQLTKFLEKSNGNELVVRSLTLIKHSVLPFWFWIKMDKNYFTFHQCTISYIIQAHYLSFPSLLPSPPITSTQNNDDFLIFYYPENRPKGSIIFTHIILNCVFKN